MLSKLSLALVNYAALGVVLAACWGAGRLMLRAAGARHAASLLHPLAIALGLGAGICVLQWLAIAGLLTRPAVLAAIGAGLVLAALQARHGAGGASEDAPPQPWTAPARCAALIGALVLLSTLPMPLRPPMEWDELAYHLPHAQQWAQAHRLQVTDWLRYPWFPYNFDLLYAGALLFGNDILPHLLHAGAGWLVAWMVLRLGLRHFDPLTACVAATIWLVLSRSDYGRAYIDMGVTLFVLAACVAFDVWRRTSSRTWLALAAFAIGVAAGSKYQVLPYLPLFAIAIVWLDRRPATWLVAVLALLVPCTYWYARNALQTGDPFNPVGGKLFGFSDWNLGDYQGQFEDLRYHAGLPHWLLWAAPLAWLLPAHRRQPAVRAATLFSAWVLLVWVVTSRYPRYLMPAYPLLALLAAAGWVQLARWIPWPAGAWRARAARWAPRALAAALLVPAVVIVGRGARDIAPTPAARDAVLSHRIPGYGLLAQLQREPVGRIYQLGLEGAIYYAPQPIWGDWFGPWRYRDVMNLEPAALREVLARQHFDALLIDTARFPDIAARPDFERHFSLARTDGTVRLYRLQLH